MKKGQPWAFNKLVKTHQARLLKIAYGITLDWEESQEVVQDVFISAHKNIKTFRQDASLTTWLRKITINHCLNWKRKWKRRFKWQHQSIASQDEALLVKAVKKGDDPEMMIREKQMARKIMSAVRSLPEKSRTVFVLSTFEGLSYQEIAAVLKIKTGTVRSRLHTARQLMADTLEA